MRKPLFVLCLLAVVATAPASSAQIARFAGDWRNITASRGIVRIIVTPSGAGANVQLFGSCSPTPCDWGVQPAVIYAPTVASNLNTTAVAMTVAYQFSFKDAIVVLRPDGAAGLSAQVYNRFRPSDGRTNYALFERFVRR